MILPRGLERARLSTGSIQFSSELLRRDVFFKSLSKSAQTLGWSTGAHGLRHGYAQDRMNKLREYGYRRQEQMKNLSQELGHFRSDIVRPYLR